MAGLTASAGATAGLGLGHSWLGVSILLVVLSVVAILGMALLGNRELSRRAFRLLTFAGDQPEPPGPPGGAREGGRGRHGRPVLAAHFAPYEARPGRRVLVVDDLTELGGPASGTVELPLRLFWSLPGHRFDLDDHDMRQWYCETVLREASRAEDLTTYLNAATLASLWPDLYLPKGIRRAWEEQHQFLPPFGVFPTDGARMGARNGPEQRSGMRVLLVSGSTRSGSANTAALMTAAALAPPGVMTVLYQGLAALPAFNPDYDGEVVPEPVAELRRELAAADVVLFCTPEYAGTLPGSLKNLLDWTVGGGQLYHKPVAWLNVAAANRGQGARQALASVLGYVGAIVAEPACRHIPVDRSAIGPDGTISDPDFAAGVAEIWTELVRHAGQNGSG